MTWQELSTHAYGTPDTDMFGANMPDVHVDEQMSSEGKKMFGAGVLTGIAAAKILGHEDAEVVADAGMTMVNP